jgi:hypothetical protein
VRGDLGNAVRQLKQESGNGLFVGGVKLPLALTELGLIDEYEFVVQPRLAGHRGCQQPNWCHAVPEMWTGMGVQDSTKEWRSVLPRKLDLQQLWH